MVAFVIFWAALAAVFFFVVGTLFKALASAFNALLGFIGRMLIFAVVFLIAALGIGFVYELMHGIVTGTLGSAIKTIVIAAVAIGILLAIVGGLGALVLELAISIAAFVADVASRVLEGAASLCEKGYAKSLILIIKQVRKC